jgi:hypothetical protein
MFVTRAEHRRRPRPCPQRISRKIAHMSFSLPTAAREVFTTSRIAEFCRLPELGLDKLAIQHAGANEPVIVFLHVVHPRLTFTNLGKTQVRLPKAVAADMQKVIEKITADWHKQRKREERDASAVMRRADALERA